MESLDQLSFGLVDVAKCRLFQPTSVFFFMHFCIFEPSLWIYNFEILNFLFFNIKLRGVSTCIMLSFQLGLVRLEILSSKNHKFTLRPQFWSFQSDLVIFEDKFFLIGTRHQAEIFRIILHIATACLTNSYQILRWIISKLASCEVLGIIILFALEFSSLKG